MKSVAFTCHILSQAIAQYRRAVELANRLSRLYPESEVLNDFVAVMSWRQP